MDPFFSFGFNGFLRESLAFLDDGFGELRELCVEAHCLIEVDANLRLGVGAEVRSFMLIGWA